MSEALGDDPREELDSEGYRDLVRSIGEVGGGRVPAKFDIGIPSR